MWSSPIKMLVRSGVFEKPGLGFGGRHPILDTLDSIGGMKGLQMDSNPRILVRSSLSIDIPKSRPKRSSHTSKSIFEPVPFLPKEPMTHWAWLKSHPWCQCQVFWILKKIETSIQIHFSKSRPKKLSHTLMESSKPGLNWHKDKWHPGRGPNHDRHRYQSEVLGILNVCIWAFLLSRDKGQIGPAFVSAFDSQVFHKIPQESFNRLKPI